MEILTKPKNALIKQYQRLFEMEGVKLSFTEDALHSVATRAIAAQDRRARPALDHGVRSCWAPCSSCPVSTASRRW